jgi:hypothetical protein
MRGLALLVEQCLQSSQTKASSCQQGSGPCDPPGRTWLEVGTTLLERNMEGGDSPIGSLLVACEVQDPVAGCTSGGKSATVICGRVGAWQQGAALDSACQLRGALSEAVLAVNVNWYIRQMAQSH